MLSNLTRKQDLIWFSALLYIWPQNLSSIKNIPKKLMSGALALSLTNFYQVKHLLMEKILRKSIKIFFKRILNFQVNNGKTFQTMQKILFINVWIEISLLDHLLHSFLSIHGFVKFNRKIPKMKKFN